MLKLFHYTPWRRLGERRYSSYTFSTSAVDEGEWSASLPGRALAPGKGPPVPIVQEAGWAPQARGKVLSPLPGIELRSPGRPARSQTLHWLSNPAYKIRTRDQYTATFDASSIAIQKNIETLCIQTYTITVSTTNKQNLNSTTCFGLINHYQVRSSLQ
jgi:hypothetical protein